MNEQQDECEQALERIEQSILGIKECIADSRVHFHAKHIYQLHDDTKFFCFLAKLQPIPPQASESTAKDFFSSEGDGCSSQDALDGRQAALDISLKFVISLHAAFLQRGAPYLGFEDNIGDLDRSFAEMHERTSHHLKKREEYGLKPGEVKPIFLHVLQIVF